MAPSDFVAERDRASRNRSSKRIFLHFLLLFFSLSQNFSLASSPYAVCCVSMKNDLLFLLFFFDYILTDLLAGRAFFFRLLITIYEQQTEKKARYVKKKIGKQKLELFLFDFQSI